MITIDKSSEESNLSDTELSLLRDLVETAQDLFWQCDAEGRYTYLNKAWEKQLGYRINEMIGHKFIKFQNKDYADRDMVEFENILRHGSTYHYETEHISKAGEKVNLIFSAKVIRNKQGQAIGMRGSAYNNTDHRKTLNKLKKSEELFRSFFKYSPMGLNVFDLKGKVIAVNSIARGYFGVSEDDPLAEYCLFDDPSITDKTKWKIRNGEIATEERCVDFEAIKKHKMYVSSKDESTRVFLGLTYAPYGPKLAEPIGFVVIIQDLTNLKKLEEERLRAERHLNQMQKLESIGTLAGGIAHDFNNILSSVIGFTELALDDAEKGSSVEDSLQEIYAGGKRARDLVKQILAFARQSDEKIKPIQIDTIAKEVLKLLRASIPTTIQITQDIKNDLTAMGNPTQVHQVLMNICTNAAQAMEDGGILEVSIKDIVIDKNDGLKDLIPGEYAEIKVSDNGMGIDPGIMDKIFDPFFTTKEVGKGTGMGLALVHGIVESYNGTITVESLPGQGAVLKVYLPLIRGQRETDLYQPEILPTGDEKILLVDDEIAIVKMSSQILQKLGYEVVFRTSSIEALALFRARSDEFDLVITDMTMPNLTGDKLAVELMFIRRDIPVILCTGYSSKISDETAKAIGIKAFAYKPVSKNDLAKTVRKVLDKAKY